MFLFHLYLLHTLFYVNVPELADKYIRAFSSFGFSEIQGTSFSMSPYFMVFFACSASLSFCSLSFSSALEIFLECWLLAKAGLMLCTSIVSMSLLISIFLSTCFFLNMIYYKLLQSAMDIELAIDAQFLDLLDPPTSFPPSEEELAMQIENKFLSECERFINNERMLYKCSKSVENRLKGILRSSNDIKEKLSTQKDKLSAISAELEKYRDHEVVLKDRERVLSMLCDLIKMEEVRKDLLLGQARKEEEWQSRSASINEQDYLGKLTKLSKTIEESAELTHFKEEFPLIKQIMLELESIFHLAVKMLTKKLLTPKMVNLILNKHYSIFLKDEVSSATFQQAITANRLQHMRINLNPMINNLNYATNIPQLYEIILTSWLRLIHEEITLFTPSGKQHIVRIVTEQLIVDLLPRMEKNIFRIKEFISVVRIRKYFHDFLGQLRKIESWNVDKKEWDSLVNVLAKCQIVVESKLSEQSEALESTKYNIYTLASYISIREHLQKVKSAIQFSIQGEKMDWQIAFYNLCSSRDPKNYPNNKSLIIFNLNIWYLYIKIIHNGKHREEGKQVMKWSQEMFTTINVQQANKKFYDSFEKVLELCGNIPAFKAVLYSELQLLGHEDLRRQIAALIRVKYVETYEKLLTKLEKEPMNNEEVKTFCHQKKINLNKFGKYSHSICVLSPQALLQQLEYD